MKYICITFQCNIIINCLFLCFLFIYFIKLFKLLDFKYCYIINLKQFALIFEIQSDFKINFVLRLFSKMKLIGNHSPYVSLRDVKINQKHKLSITKKKKLSSEQIQLIPYHKFLQDITKIDLKNLNRIKTNSNKKKQRNNERTNNLNIEPFNFQVTQLQKNQTFQLINTEIQFENSNSDFEKQTKPKSESEYNQRKNKINQIIENEEDDLSCDEDFEVMMTKKIQTKVSQEKFKSNFFPFLQAKTSSSLNCRDLIMPSIQERNPSQQSEKYFQQNLKINHKKNLSYDNYFSKQTNKLDNLQKSFIEPSSTYTKKHFRNMSTGLTDKQAQSLKQRVVQCIKVTPFKDSIKIDLNVSGIMKNFKIQNEKPKHSVKPFKNIQVHSIKRRLNAPKRQFDSICCIDNKNKYER